MDLLNDYGVIKLASLPVLSMQTIEKEHGGGWGAGKGESSRVLSFPILPLSRIFLHHTNGCSWSTERVLTYSLHTATQGQIQMQGFFCGMTKDLFENDKLDLPAPRYLEDGSKLSPVIVGDDGFPLNHYMLKPPPGKHLTLPERKNYGFSRTRMCVENAYRILAARWRIFQNPIEFTNIMLPKLITGASVTLHDLERKDLSDITPDRITRDGVVVPGNWRSVPNVFANMDQTGMDCTRERMRNAYTQYFNSPEGEVAPQKRYVLSTGIDTEMMEVV